MQRFSFGKHVMLCGVCVDLASPLGPRILIVASRAKCLLVLRPASLATAAELAMHPLGSVGLAHAPFPRPTGTDAAAEDETSRHHLAAVACRRRQFAR